ncbi:FtsW/RodA/SpoVE family cell cycle protein [Dyadobacter frigoris]|uniref:Probable peptidoglycan glycosyltransferase FtsW n=1 Tax=Dyadobacter frigoris TaxID=2576211 RepID=A0A4V6Y1Y3_9BACT|nr:FtsW/RodA/SpoVE family cell cycle protein [Dyadobacter frigoris]TKT91103.1 cell division protein FtsW [Dyadobacter frigoris]GLU55028.1 cell division protein FtsW [Dyadobacter frigoris]
MDGFQKVREETQAWFSRNLKGDPWIWGICIGMLLSSIVVVYSASVKDAYSVKQGNTEYYLFKHSLLCFLSLLIMFFVHRIPYIKFVYVTRMAVWSSILLLIFAMFFGRSVNEASRWIEIPIIGQRFQPSEWAKVALIAHLSLILARHIKGGWNTRELFMEPLALVGAVCGLIFTSNVSTAFMLAGICFLLMFVGKVPIHYLLFTAMGLVFFAGVAILLNSTQRSNTAQNRITSFLDKDVVVYQSQQSYMAMARGGLYGEGVAKSRQRRFLPEPQKDFIFAVVVEEYGTLGGTALMVLYLILLFRGLKAIEATKRPFGGLLSAGLTFVVVSQAFSAMAVTVGLVPVTGQTLPFFSQGGTSLLFTGVAMGMILSVSRGEKMDEQKI